VPVGETVEVGAVLARIATDARPGQAHLSEAEEGPAAANGQARGAGTTGDAETTGDGEVVGTGEATAALEAPGAAGELIGDAEPRRRRYSPVVMRIAAEHGIDLERVEGTGRGGRVRKQDVLAAVERAGAAPADAPQPEPPLHIESPYQPDAPPAPRRREPRLPVPEPAGTGAPLSRMRQAIGARMHQSLQTAATCTTVAEADLTRIEAARRAARLTALPYVARATVETLREFPVLNATLEGDTFTTYDAVHLGIAVSLGDDGLIVPVIRDAQDLSVEGLAARIKDIAKRARTRQLEPDEVRGGTFTITNPGGYGSILATPVINQPQVAILDTEATVKRAVVIDDAIAIRPMAYFCMSWDHRALDGAEAARFLSSLRGRLEG
jgi:pyruvate/2-oxoglutarate dehydrogenase complex dihydrolipoamide acyltransferase (E2) component